MDDFSTLYNEYSSLVYYYLYSLTRNKNVSEELTQETMLRAMLNINSFRGDCKTSVWLCQIAKNAYFEWLKKNKRTVSLDDEVILRNVIDDFTTAFEDKDMANQILLQLHELKEPYKEVFSLHVLGSISLVRISKLFGRSESWARVTFYRAKAMILSKII